MEIALGGHRQVEATVAAQLREHVVEEGSPVDTATDAGAVDGHRHVDRVSLVRRCRSARPVHHCRSRDSPRLARSAVRNRSFSPAVPTVTRRH